MIKEYKVGKQGNSLWKLWLFRVTHNYQLVTIQLITISALFRLQQIIIITITKLILHVLHHYSIHYIIPHRLKKLFNNGNCR